MPYSNDINLAFGRTLIDRISLFASDCEAFGMLDGCKVNCPVFVSGDCETAKEEPEMYIDLITDEYGKEGEDVEEFIALYPQFEELLNA